MPLKSTKNSKKKNALYYVYVHFVPNIHFDAVDMKINDFYIW